MEGRRDPSDDLRDTQTAREQEASDSDLRPESRTYRRKLLRAVGAGGALTSLAGCTSLFTFGAEPKLRERPKIDDGTAEDDTDDEGTDRDGSDKRDDETDDESYHVDYRKQSETVEVPWDKSLLVAGEEQGWDLPFQCRRGICGQCTARLWGNAHERVVMEDPNDPSRRNQFLTDEEIRDGYTLTCVGYPRDDFTLETSERDSLDR